MRKPWWHRWPCLFALLLGVGVWCGVGWWLRPKPEWTLSISEDHKVAVSMNFVVVSPDPSMDLNGNIKSYEYYAVEDGRMISRSAPRNANNDLSNLPSLPQPPLPNDSNRYGLTHWSGRTILRDLHTGQNYRFHNFTHEETCEGVSWSISDPVETAVISHPLPFQLATHLLQPLGATPADAWSRVCAALTPGSQPILATIVTVPAKNPVGTVMIPATHTHVRFSPSCTGKYLAVTCYPFDVVNNGKILGVWNVRERYWMSIPFNSLERLAGVFFFDDDYIITESDQSGQGTRNYLWHVPTGTKVSSVELNRTFDPHQNIVTKGNGVEFVRLAMFANPVITERCEFEPSTGLKVLNQWTIRDDASYRLQQLFQGMESTYFSVYERKLPTFLQQYLPDSWHRWLQSWLSVKQLSVYDWPSGQLHTLAFNAFGYTAHNGEYLVVCHYHQNKGTNTYTRVEGYHMPLTFYSPLWSRTAGLVSCLLVFVLLRPPYQMRAKGENGTRNIPIES